MTESSFDPLIDQTPSRFVVGIDLGTTNSAVGYVDSQEDPWVIRVFSIRQYVSATEQESLETLPSFYFQPLSMVDHHTAGSEADLHHSASARPTEGRTFFVGAFARDETAKTSRRGIASAKSWLCHNGVDRSAPLLPWQGADDVQKLSPVEASAAYLEHIRGAWDSQFPDFPLAEQDLVLTLPASFDEVARQLTIEAAAKAGLPRIMLIEEPQAAFYAWVYKHCDDWERQVTAGQKILVCDIGGGTTDFTLIKVRKSQQGSPAEPAKTNTESTDPAEEEPSGNRDKLQFHRMAVGNHLILGGDNLDLAIARYLEDRLTGGGSLPSFQWDLLVGQSRSIKEQMMVEGGPASMLVHLPARGSRLLEGSLQVEVTRDEIRNLLMEGFLPWVDLREKPLLHQSGFQEFGLPFARDPAISKYLAQFLVSHADQGAEPSASQAELEEVDSNDPRENRVENWLVKVRPDVLLFNGGFFASSLLRQRVVEQICRWFRHHSDPAWMPLVLDNDRLDLAVARGAAYYGMVRRDQGVRIAATLARSFYIGIGGTPPTAVCIMPGSAEPGHAFTLTDRNFKLTVSQPVEFNLFVSSTRLTDQPGTLVPIDPEHLRELPPIRTILKTTSRNEKADLSVNLQIALTELGTIDLSCNEVNSDRRWRLQFDVRAATKTEMQEHDGTGESQGVLDDSIWSECESLIVQVFGDGSSQSGLQPQALIQEMQQKIQLPRDQWPTTLLRRIWDSLIEWEKGRKFSPQHESRWLNLVGFSLRPGYGCALDDWRVTETWRTVHKKIIHGGAAQKNELLILWRRVAGGLTRGQQLALAEPWITSVKTMVRQFHGKPGKPTAGGLRPDESIEVWRLLGSLELLPVEQKQELGKLIFSIADKPKLTGARNAMLWAIGRLGQRRPLYGPLNSVLPVEVVEQWIGLLMNRTAFGKPEQDLLRNLALVQLARRTQDRYRDISESMRDQVIRWLQQNGGTENAVSLVSEGGKLDAEELGQVFGESLPPGLRLE